MTSHSNQKRAAVLVSLAGVLVGASVCFLVPEANGKYDGPKFAPKIAPIGGGGMGGSDDPWDTDPNPGGRPPWPCDSATPPSWCGDPSHPGCTYGDVASGNCVCPGPGYDCEPFF